MTTAPRRPDLLFGLTREGRLCKEQEDREYLITHPTLQHYENPEATGWFGKEIYDQFRSKPKAPWQSRDPLDVVICERVDLDHPIHFADNRSAECVDCGCDLQYRPTAPRKGDKLCICCTARRVREDEEAAAKPRRRPHGRNSADQ
jgi:hypothetical protein